MFLVYFAIYRCLHIHYFSLPGLWVAGFRQKSISCHQSHGQLLFANLNICKRRYKGRGYSTLLAWNIFISPIVSISYLKGVWLLNGAHNKYKLRVYKGCIYANYGFIMYFVGLIIVSLISNEAGNLLASQNWIWFIFGVPTLYLYQENMSVCIAHDTFPRMLALIFGLIFYNPFYSNRVLKNKWI